MTILLPLFFGVGVFMIYDWLVMPPRPSRRRARSDWLAQWLVSAGLTSTSPRQFIAACAAAGFVSGLLAALAVGSPVIALLALLGGTYAPVGYCKSRRIKRRRVLQQCWPEAIELLASAVRVGDTLPTAMGVVADRGPEPLRPFFRGVVADHLVSGDFAGALARLRDDLADATPDRIVATLTIAHRVGGRELGRVLRMLATFLREDLATRQEIEARQSWTVVAARVAAAAPWLVLLMTATRPSAAGAYDSVEGVIVLVGGAIATIVGYRIMVALGRLKEEPRVLCGSPLTPDEHLLGVNPGNLDGASA